MSQQWQPPGNGSASGTWGPPASPVATSVEDYGAPALTAQPWEQATGYADPSNRAPGEQATEIPDAVAGLLASSSRRLDSLQTEVASLRIRGGKTKVERQVRIGGAALMTAGVVLIVIAWFKASAANTSVNNQMAYLISGGLIGLALVGIGAAVYLRSWMARQRYWQARQVVESREYAAQVLMLLARIEKLLGGSGDLPAASPHLAPGSLWDSIAPPPEDTGGRYVEPLVGDPLSDPLRETDLGAVEAPGVAEAPASAEAPATADTPRYENEHGHIWDHVANQWYDPASHQWFDGIAGFWYPRDAPPPAL